MAWYSKNSGWGIGIVLACMGFLSVSTATASLPEDQVMRYSIRQTPTDPESPVTWTIDLSLSAQAEDGDFVGWRITRVTIAKLNTAGTPLEVWEHDLPPVASADGLWWVEHADLQNPVPEEFTEPPWLEGTATARDPEDPDLDYLIEGIPYDLPDPPVFTNAALDFWFIYRVDPVPLGPAEEGDDEPVVVMGVQLPF